jgi:SAM-dependent methyltransferase
MTDVATAYSRRAAEYVDLLGSMAAVHPSDRQLIDSWSEQVRGRTLDAGCGPGHWTNHLAARGLDIRGLDLAPDFVAHARTTYPTVRFDVGSIDEIDDADAALGGILSWFSTIHHTPSQIVTPIAEFARTLQAGGLLMLGYFDGASVEPFDHAVIRAWRWPGEELQSLLETAGFHVVETHRRTGEGQRSVGAILCRRATGPRGS